MITNDVQTSASIVSQDIVNKDDSTTFNILQPQTTQPALFIEDHTIQQNSDDNMEAEFPIADDDSSKSSVAKMPPIKKPFGPAIERRRKKNYYFLMKIQTKKTLFCLKQTLLPLIYQRNPKQWEGRFQPWNPIC